ncbi:MAG: hypothetical protein P8Z75_03840 [Gammaproteobacteria bacterium]|jgi:hypothetical protein
MSKLQMLLFCGTCLLLSAGTALLLYPHATISQKKLEYAKTPQPMENLPDVNLGPNLGELPVTVLVGYYIDNPPKPSNDTTARHEEQFGGC